MVLLTAIALFAFPGFADELLDATGFVEDSRGRPIEGAVVELRSASGLPLARARTDASGQFRLSDLAHGDFLLEIRAPLFVAHRRALRVDSSSVSAPFRIVLSVHGVPTELTVTAIPGRALHLEDSPRISAVVEDDILPWRGIPTLAHALSGNPGIHQQQSTTGQASPFLRGLTGFHVLNLVDGIRFNNSAFRFGPNQYLALLDAGAARAVEVVLGPASSEYGSDALGGTIQYLTASPPFADDPRWRGAGKAGGHFASADLSTGTSAEFSLSNTRWSTQAGGTWRHFNDLRAGEGIDSRHALRRYLGLESESIRGLLGSRQRETAFSQFGGHFRLAARIQPDQAVTLWYQRSEQRGVRGYKDLWGGQGRLQAAFEPQALDFLYLRYVNNGFQFLDSLSATVSMNSQEDGARSQGLRYEDPIRVDRTRIRSLGLAAQAQGHRGNGHNYVFGGEVYDESVDSLRLIFAPGTGYRTLAGYGQTSLNLPNRRFRITAGGRLTRVDFRGRSFGDATFNGSLSVRLTGPVRFHAVVSRGFRAPNLNDLGALGLQDLGFEFPAESLAPLGAWIGVDSGEAALSSGSGVAPLDSERMFNFEAGLVWSSRRSYLRGQWFDAELYDAIARRTILFPADNIPAEIAGVRVRPAASTPEQRARGVTVVATEFDPRAVKAFVNIGRQRYMGVEFLLRQNLSDAWTVEGNYSFLAGRELDPAAPIRRLAPQQATLLLHYRPSTRIWAELNATASGSQRRLSGGDLSDERIGGERSRNDIAAFFRSARLAPYVRGGIFTPTGEALHEIQDRVLPLLAAGTDSTRVPLLRSTPGFGVWSLRAGLRVGEKSDLVLGLLNVADRNYRYHGSGVDAPGRSITLGWQTRF